MKRQRAPPKQRRVTVFWRSKEKYVTVAAAGIITAAAKKEMSGDTLIEIHRYYGERKGERVLRVTQEEAEGAEVSAEVAAYEQAADQLENMIKSRRESLEARQQAARKAAV